MHFRREERVLADLFDIGVVVPDLFERRKLKTLQVFQEVIVDEIDQSVRRYEPGLGDFEIRLSRGSFWPGCGGWPCRAPYRKPLPPSFPVPWLGPDILPTSLPKAWMERYSLATRMKASRSLINLADQGDPGLPVVRAREGLFLFAGRAAELLTISLILDQGDVPFLRGDNEESELVLAHPLFDQETTSPSRDRQRRDPDRLLRILRSRASTSCLGRGWFSSRDASCPPGIETPGKYGAGALDAGHALPAEVVHEPAQDPFVEDRIGSSRRSKITIHSGLARRGLGPVRLRRPAAAAPSHSSMSRLRAGCRSAR